MAKSKSGTANLFANMQKVMDKDEIKQKKVETEKEQKIISQSSKETKTSDFETSVKVDQISVEDQFDSIKPVNDQPKKLPVKNQSKKVKSKMGRPVIREGEYIRFAIDLPAEIASQVNIAKLAYNNSVRTYVTKLIQKDISANMDMYMKFAEMSNDVMNN